MVGIIPARAGFTTPDQCRSARCADHPRSRGVYRFAKPQPATKTGSSPLARGLLSFLQVDATDLGIIPARAGFTPRRCPLVTVKPDHPRSRGVYSTVPIALIATFGSSPLARGLLTYNEASLNEYGIIPARAGFTGAWKVEHDGRPGSSPLARGLLLG